MFARLSFTSLISKLPNSDMRLEEEYTLSHLDRLPARDEVDTCPADSGAATESFPCFEDPINDHSLVTIPDLTASNVSYSLPKSMSSRFKAIQNAEFSGPHPNRDEKDQDEDTINRSDESRVKWLQFVADSLAPPESLGDYKFLKSKSEADFDFQATEVLDTKGGSRMIPQSVVSEWTEWSPEQQESFVSMPKHVQMWYGDNAKALYALRERMSSAFSLQFLGEDEPGQ